MGFKNEKLDASFVRFSLWMCKNTRNSVRNMLTWQIFPQKHTKKALEFGRGGPKKVICDSDICPKSGKFLSIHCNVTKFGGSVVFDAQNLPDFRQIPCSFWPISGKFPDVSCNIMTYASWLKCYEIWQISGKFPSLKKLPNFRLLSCCTVK